MNLSKWIELITVLGPKLKEALPLIIALIKLFSNTAENGGPVSYSMPATPSKEYIDAVDLAKANGATEDEAVEIAQLIQARQA